VSDLDNQDDQTIIFEAANDPVIANPSRQLLTEVARAVCPGDPNVQEVGNFPLNRSIEFFKRSSCARVNLNRPGQALCAPDRGSELAADRPGGLPRGEDVVNIIFNQLARVIGRSLPLRFASSDNRRSISESRLMESIYLHHTSFTFS
jgi:hypothetical protein